MYDIAIKVTPELIEKRPEYQGVTFVVMATAYIEEVANIICNVLQSLADDGSELVIMERAQELGTDPSIVFGVYTDD